MVTRILLALALCSGCAVDAPAEAREVDDQAVVFRGTPDHAAVVALELVPGEAACGGVRTSPHEVHTALHCLTTRYGLPDVVEQDGGREEAVLGASWPELDLAVLRTESAGRAAPAGTFRGTGELTAVTHQPSRWNDHPLTFEEDHGSYFGAGPECVEGESGSPVFEGEIVVGIVLHGGLGSGHCWVRYL